MTCFFSKYPHTDMIFYSENKARNSKKVACDAEVIHGRLQAPGGHV